MWPISPSTRKITSHDHERNCQGVKKSSQSNIQKRHLRVALACSTLATAAGGDCMDIRCMTSEREDKTGVYFQPITDLKTLAAYHVQEATK
jgi:hypothetical protein